ncbi:hypothetical protein [Streptomyces albicerus]|uniref:hypothetical protein n=1 Tax=Streptomyces albicerus TaxID=2569859 RepID=UPI00124B7A78|nr:hypothetical protein [Streptomyces albicerus]
MPVPGGFGACVPGSEVTVCWSCTEGGVGVGVGVGAASSPWGAVSSGHAAPPAHGVTGAEPPAAGGDDDGDGDGDGDSDGAEAPLCHPGGTASVGGAQGFGSAEGLSSGTLAWGVASSGPGRSA